MTIKHHKLKNKPIFICAIDASKAFDKVNRVKLMHSLISKIDPEIWIILKNYYENSHAFVSNSKQNGPLFKTCVGVKQGGPLSIYVEQLIKIDFFFLNIDQVYSIGIN